MNRVLITGMSGTGKSTTIEALATLGFSAVDADVDVWSEMIDVDGAPDREWVWREDRIAGLLAREGAGTLFLGGCASNQGLFYPQFDHIVLLTAPLALIRERLATRTTNPFGKQPDELARVLEDRRTIEPLLRRGATLELDTSAPVAEVVEAIIGHVGA